MSSFPSLSQPSQAFPLPSIPEDTLHYTVHPSPTIEDVSALAVLISDHVEGLLLKPWLWNKDSWELKRVDGPDASSSGKGKEKLEGRMRVGDSVDDEWLVVWLLREVSKKWQELVISVRDTDGEFMLIEAANELPSWVTPENAENRLWLSGGHLHLIPLSVRSSGATLPPRQLPDDEADERQYDNEAYISEEDGIHAVRTGKYRAEAKMERAVWDRIACYPDALNTHRHHTKAYIPEPVARALSSNPELIQKAVEGFYVRDPSQLRAASRMTHFPPSPSVLSSVLMTRAAYAQLQGQVFHPPRVFGPEWHVREGKELDDERRWRDIGVKISVGFEIMYREGGKKGRSGDAGNEDWSKDPAYLSYLGTLQKAGFFGTELQGSEKWRKREEEALKGWKDVRAADTTSQRPSFAYQVDRAIEAASSTSITSLQATADSPEDSDSWLEVSPDELDGMMLRASGQGQGSGDRPSANEKMEVGEEHGKVLGDLAKKVEEFVGGQGDIEGARFLDELSDDDMNDSDEEDEAEDPELTKVEKDERMKNLVAPLPEGEWGSKTAKSDIEMADNNNKDKQGQKGKKAKEEKAAEKDDRPKMRPPLFAKQEYDGVVSDSDEDEEDESNLPPAGSIGRKIGEMRWADTAPKIQEIDDDDVDGQDEEMEKQERSRKFGLGDDIDEQMRKAVWGASDNMEQGEDAPQVVDGEEDIDMAEEAEEFIKFSKDVLGIDEDMWQGILTSRREKGDFVPDLTNKPEKKKQSIPEIRPKVSQTPATKQPEKAAQATEKKEGEANMDLNSFESVMEAMDAELARIKGPTKSNPRPTPAPKTGISASSSSKQKNTGPLPPLPTEADLDALDEDDLEAMDRELKAALKSAGIEDDEDEDDIEEVGMLDDEGKREYEMMRDFLESYKSQGGGSGVVGNLFGRLGEKR